MPQLYEATPVPKEADPTADCAPVLHPATSWAPEYTDYPCVRGHVQRLSDGSNAISTDQPRSAPILTEIELERARGLGEEQAKATGFQSDLIYWIGLPIVALVLILFVRNFVREVFKGIFK